MGRVRVCGRPIFWLRLARRLLVAVIFTRCPFLCPLSSFLKGMSRIEYANYLALPGGGNPLYGDNTGNFFVCDGAPGLRGKFHRLFVGYGKR